ncbi:hypothetical protein NMG60_11024207 [Bertholletia excelsa]
MQNLLPELLIGYFTVSSIAHSAERSTKILFSKPNSAPAGRFHIPPSKRSLLLKENKTDSVVDKISEMVKEKLSLGSKILQVGGVGKIFNKNFSVGEGEKLLKASECYLSTTAGAIAGLLFISTEKVAYISKRAVKLYSSTNGRLVKIHYKVVIPLGNIKRAHEGQNTKKHSCKYIEIVTVDNFDFWFTGFLNYRKTLKRLQQAISLAQHL